MHRHGQGAGNGAGEPGQTGTNREQTGTNRDELLEVPDGTSGSGVTAPDGGSAARQAQNNKLGGLIVQGGTEQLLPPGAGETLRGTGGTPRGTGGTPPGAQGIPQGNPQEHRESPQGIPPGNPPGNPPRESPRSRGQVLAGHSRSMRNVSSVAGSVRTMSGSLSM